MNPTYKKWPEIYATLDRYRNNFRREDLPELAISGIYVLKPPEEPGAPLKIYGKWPEVWPNAERKGVYLILGGEYQLLYVGKASANNTLGVRLSSYFVYDSDCSCKVVHQGWTKPPRYVVTVAVPEGLTFEAPAIEEYLIGELNPPNNSIGLLSKGSAS